MCAKAMDDCSLLRVKIAAHAPAVNHLMFADGSLFLSLSNPKATRKLTDMFTRYEAVSGQAINLDKSTMTFGSKVRPEVKTRKRSVLGVHNDGGIGKYLGMPVQFGSKKGEMFAYIVDKVKQWLKVGSRNTLLRAERMCCKIHCTGDGNIFYEYFSVT